MSNKFSICEFSWHLHIISPSINTMTSVSFSDLVMIALEEPTVAYCPEPEQMSDLERYDKMYERELNSIQLVEWYVGNANISDDKKTELLKSLNVARVRLNAITVNNMGPDTLVATPFSYVGLVTYSVFEELEELGAVQ